MRIRCSQALQRLVADAAVRASDPVLVGSLSRRRRMVLVRHLRMVGSGLLRAEWSPKQLHSFCRGVFSLAATERSSGATQSTMRARPRSQRAPRTRRRTAHRPRRSAERARAGDDPPGGHFPGHRAGRAALPTGGAR